MLHVKNLAVKYGDAVIFKNLSFELKPGEILGIRGVNGSGKSTLLRALAGVSDDSAEIIGEINYSGKRVEDLSVAERCAEVGIIFQNPDNQLFSPLVQEEIVFALENLCVPRDEMQRRVDEITRTVGVENLLGAKTNALSGGEKQLVAIAAVMIMHPAVLLCDEILSRVDINRKRILRGVIRNYAADGNSVVLVSHSEKELSVADRVIDIVKGKDYSGEIL